MYHGVYQNFTPFYHLFTEKESVIIRIYWKDYVQFWTNSNNSFYLIMYVEHKERDSFN